MYARTFFVVLCMAGTVMAGSSFTPGNNVIRTKSVPATPDPVEATGGALYFSKPLLECGGPMELSFNLSYNSGAEEWTGDVRPPFWWSHKYTLEKIDWYGTNLFKVGFEHGSEVQFVEQTNGWQLAGPGCMGNAANGSSVRCDLHVSTDYVYFVNYDREHVCIFEKVPFDRYRVKTVFDRQTNSLTYTYATAQIPTPDRIEDTWGNYLAFTRDNYLITGVVDALGRHIGLHYTNAPDNNNQYSLVGVTDAMGQRTRYTYMVVTNVAGMRFTDNIAAIISPAGLCTYSQVYAYVALGSDEHARVIEQRDALGHSVVFAYDATNHTVATTWPNSNTVTYAATREYGALERITDAHGRSIEYAHNDHQQLTAWTDREGGTTHAVYDDATRLAHTVSNAADCAVWCEYGTVTQTFCNPYTNESIQVVFPEISAVHYQDGSVEHYYYNSHGALVSNVSRTGAARQYVYDARGLLCAEHNALGGSVYYAWTENARVAAVWTSDPRDGTNHYSYDAIGRMLTNQYPDGSFTACAYDANDNIVWLQDARGFLWHYAYDVNGNLTAVTDPYGHTTVLAYDALNRLTAVTNRLGQVFTRSYDAMGRLSALTGPLGNTTRMRTDMQGSVTNLIDPAGNSYQSLFTPEGLMCAAYAPSGLAATYGYNALGYLVAFTNALGHAWHIERDAMNRVTKVEDPEQASTVFEYDARGALVSVTNAALGAPRYAYDALGFLTNLHAVNGGDWRFSRSALAQLTTVTDPLGHAIHYQYTPSRQPSVISYPDGSSVHLAYDAGGFVTQKTYATGMTHTFGYDAAGQLIETHDVTLARDAEGQITNALCGTRSFSADYDAEGRLARLGYDNEACAVFYAYDQRGFLTSVSNTLTHAAVQFVHNADGLLTSITRPNGVATFYSWDTAGQLRSIQHGSIASQHYTYTSAGHVHSCSYAVPLDPADYVTNSACTLAFDAAYRITNAPYACDALGRLTNMPAGALVWDAASRLVQLGSATFSYDTLNHLVAAQGNGWSNQFWYHHALNNGAPVADDRFFYVYTPAGRLVYLVARSGPPTTHYYHFDRNGSTLFLTDDTGTLSDAYAYSPYGQVLAHSGTMMQPFTFCGQSGVMRPAAADIYAMRVRWYDAATARFLSREPAWPRLDDPAALNPYQYAANNPLSFGDTSGLAYEEEIARAERDLFYAKLTIKPFYALLKYNPYTWVMEGIDYFFNEPIAPVVPVEKREGPMAFLDRQEKQQLRHYERQIEHLKIEQQIENEFQERERRKQQARRAFEKKYPALKQLALQRARHAVLNMKIANHKAPHPWGKMDRNQDDTRGMWIKADGQWYFFPDFTLHNDDDLGQFLIKPGFDPHGKYHDRANIGTVVDGVEIGVWLHNVQEFHQGRGPAW